MKHDHPMRGNEPETEPRRTIIELSSITVTICVCLLVACLVVLCASLMYAGEL
jgi:hypothetical protein